MLDSLSYLEKLEALALLEERQTIKEQNKLYFYSPYAKQREFHYCLNRERLFMAGNQLGKTWAGGYEAAFHATGIYPDDWKGKRIEVPNKGWVGGPSGEFVRDNAQRVLFGEVGETGTGTIPKHLIIGKPTAARGVSDLIDTARIRHISGGISYIKFKTYDQGRIKWQGTPVNWIWADEEPPIDIYTEALTRTNATRGFVFITFTPLLGMSDTVMRFLSDDPQMKSPDSAVINMTIEDAEHYTPEQRAAIIASYPAHEREARTKGTPMLGSGRVFPIPEEALYEDRIEIKPHWPRIVGIDFGIDHPFAAVWIAWDRDTDTVHIYDCYRVKDGSVNTHVPAVRTKGPWIPVAWPHDGLVRDKGSGHELAKQYRDAGLNMLPDRATFENGTNGVEAGIMDMLTRMETVRLKVARHLSDWFEEFRLYHRENGLLVKERDDLMSATRYAIMMLRHAEVMKKTQPLKYQKMGTI